MADLADIPDVESRWRALRGQETINAAAWLRDASAVLRTLVAGVDVRYEANEAYADMVRAVVAMAVVRLFRGKDRADPADYSTIFFTRSEIESLTNGGAASGAGAFMVQILPEPGVRLPLNAWELNL